MLYGNIVTSAAQALLAAYIAVTLWRGAVSPARKMLAATLASLAMYGTVLAIFYALPPDIRHVANFVSAMFVLIGSAGLFTYARWMAAGSPKDAPPVPTRTVKALVSTCVIAAALGAFAIVEKRHATLYFLWIFAAMFGFFAGGIVVLTRANLHGRRGIRSMIAACAFPLAPIVGIWLPFVGVAISEEVFGILRDLCMLSCWYSILSSYLDHGHEPMSLKERLVAGTLTITLALVTVVAHLAVPFVARRAADEASGAAAGAALAGWLLGVVALAFALPTTVLPRLFRESVLSPLERLGAGLKRVESGELVTIPVDHEDELGRVTRSFNGMSRAISEGRGQVDEHVRVLEAKGREIEDLNVELRRQVAARSRQLSEALARVEPSEGGIELGALVDGRYRVENRIGAGGMGVVYGVLRVTDERRLALKVMAGSTSKDDGLRFAREAEIAAALDHENLVHVIDVGMHHGVPYLVMDRIDGGSLEDARARFGDLAWAVPMLGQVARGLAALHERGIVHRDLKPANVLLRSEGTSETAKITDFGIARSDALDAFAATARAVGSARPRTGLTANGALIGTLAYMAPELARGTLGFQPPADVFALGIMAYEMVGAGHPFRLPPLLDALADRPIPDPPELPAGLSAELAAIVRSAIAISPSARPTAAALEIAFTRGHPAHAH